MMMALSVPTKSRGRTKRALEERGPTPETKAKLRFARVQQLYSAKVIDQQQYAAACEVRSIVDSVSALWFKPHNTEGGNSNGSAPRHHLDAFPPALLKPYQNRYLPWIKAMGDRKHCGLRWSEILTGVIVDCHDLADYPPGAAGVIREGLDAY